MIANPEGPAAIRSSDGEERATSAELAAASRGRPGECQSYGGYWTNPSAEAELEPASEPGELDWGPDSPRWRQRAFSLIIP